MPLFVDKLAARLPRLADFAMSFSMIQRAGHTLYPGDTLFHRLRRMRLWLRSIVWWHSTTVWLRRCSNSSLREIVRRHPLAIERPHRPFLHGGFSSRERIAASLDHQTLTEQRVPQLAQRIAREGHATIAQFAVGAERWQITLESLDQFQKEGDWTLCIRDANGRRVVSCTFSLAYLGGKVRRPRLCVGSVQGPDTSINGRELFRALTKRWYGLRPKVFVIYLAQCIASGLGTGGTFIVSKRAHIYANWRYCLRRRRVAADYDGLSLECGAVARWNGWFVLAPPVRHTRDADGGNALRRKRNSLREDLAAQIRNSLEG
ncbi:DUF535 family protein [Paraburkholderia sp.]|uniref:DUF535 family protein n=1 Tax=Paraburkholderia sp. TaxID=1926495 RepID=UPI003D6FD9D6